MCSVVRYTQMEWDSSSVTSVIVCCRLTKGHCVLDKIIISFSLSHYCHYSSLQDKENFSVKKRLHRITQVLGSYQPVQGKFVAHVALMICYIITTRRMINIAKFITVIKCQKLFLSSVEQDFGLFVLF